MIGHGTDAVGVADRCPAELLDHERHGPQGYSPLSCGPGARPPSRAVPGPGALRRLQAGPATLLTVGTEKRERQKAGRQLRREAEQKAAKRKRGVRRGITIVIAVAVVVAVSVLLFHGSSKSSTTPTTTKPSTTATTAPAPTGGSGNKSAVAMTTSADCPSNFSATLNKPSFSSYPPMTIDPSKTYTATITTDVGTITVDLDAKAAPKAVNYFVFLANQH